MNKKYQIFISSTYMDLKEERRAAIDAIFDTGNIPVGMEQFPASDLSQWEYIMKMLKDTDYVVLISAGRYGSLIKGDKVSWTEKEFNYAIEKGIPVLPIIIKDIDELPVKKVDKYKERINEFHKKLKDDRTVSTYSNISELKACVKDAIRNAIIDRPREGWVRATEVEKKRQQ